MNPDRIYQQHRDDAFAKQATAAKYSTFVAMPFGNTFSYRATEIYEQVICAAADHANQSGKAKRLFDRPYRVDQGPGLAQNITEEIIVSILEMHFVVADLTLANHGVLVELGLALGLKPTNRIVAIMQGSPSNLHFDLKHTNVLNYDNPKSVIEKISNALVAAAESFELERDRYVESVTKSLSPDAIGCMNWYGRLQQNSKAAALHREAIDNLPREALPVNVSEKESLDRAYAYFTDAIRELIDKRLFWCEWQQGAAESGDAFGVHATDLGWVAIQHIWKDLKRPA